MEFEVTVNGERMTVSAEPFETLAEVLRDRLRLTGTKVSCGVQVCGACTVLVDGRPVSSCLFLFYEARGRSVQTIEGLSREGGLHPVQRAFLEESAFQCGFCTPGMIMTVKALLDEHPTANREEIARYLSGNICRCTGYRSILDAAQRAQRELGEGKAR